MINISDLSSCPLVLWGDCHGQQEQEARDKEALRRHFTESKLLGHKTGQRRAANEFGGANS